MATKIDKISNEDISTTIEVEVGSDLHKEHIRKLEEYFSKFSINNKPYYDNDSMIQFLAESKQLVTELTGVELPEMYNDFFMDPASSRLEYHGYFDHGLLKHSLRVYYILLKLVYIFPKAPTYIDSSAVIFHDLVKVGSYKITRDAIRGYFVESRKWTEGYYVLPHGSESLFRIEHDLGIKLSRNWAYAVALHMGAYEDSNKTNFTEACKKMPEVLLLHEADMIASTQYNE